MSRNILTSLLAAQVTSYDKTKTYLAGNTYLKNLNGVNAIGPQLTKFKDLNADFGGTITPSGMLHATSNGRKFVLSTVSAGVASIGLYSINYATGVESPIGQIKITLPNAGTTTHTPKFIRAIDTGTTGWQIYIGTTASVVISGGVFLVNKVDLADFTMNPSPVQFFMGVASNVKAVYQMQDSGSMGAAHLMTTVMGGGYESTLLQLLFTFGTAATMNFRGIDTTLTPTVGSQTATSATTVSGTTFTLTGHGYLTGDQIVITANPPTNFTASLGTAIETVYFVRSTVTANTFELASTTAGAAIVTASATSPTFVRAYGQTSSLMIAARKSGAIVTGFVGTALLLDCQQTCTPVDGTNAGILCYFFPTTTNFYCFPLASMTAGITSISGTLGVDNLGTGSDYVAPVNVVARYSMTLGKIIYASANFSFLAKHWANGVIDTSFGTQINTWLEGTGRLADYFRGSAIGGISTSSGILLIGMTTVGQRGVLSIDMHSDAIFDFSYVVSPVTYAGDAFLKYVQTIETYYDVTDTPNLFIRSANTSTDAIFAGPTGGWVAISKAADISSVALGRYFQIKANFNILTQLSGIPTQLIDFVVGVVSKSEISPSWTGDANNTSAAGVTPAHVAFRQAMGYTAVVALRVTGVDDSGNIITFDTDTNFALFDKTSNNGTSWTAMASANDYPNTPLTSGIRLNPTGLAAVNYTWGITEK